jgi:hypothetical protein
MRLKTPILAATLEHKPWVKPAKCRVLIFGDSIDSAQHVGLDEASPNDGANVT